MSPTFQVLMAEDVPAAPPPSGSWLNTSYDVGSASLRNDFTGVVGCKVRIPFWAPTTLCYGLGRWIVSGNSGTHEVRLYDAEADAESPTLLGTVSINTSLFSPGDFGYVAFSSPVAISVNHFLYIASKETSGGDQWYDANLNSCSTYGGFGDIKAMYNDSGSPYFQNGWWHDFGDGNPGYCPLNMKIDA